MLDVDLDSLENRIDSIRRAFNSAQPYRYVVIEDFLLPLQAEELLIAYPTVDEGGWDSTTYLDQANKFRLTKFESNSPFSRTFSELNSPVFLNWLERMTSIEGLIADVSLFGGGLHQSVAGAFLNIHVDFNLHPDTKNIRSLNLLLYMNKDWQNDYEGYLELWERTSDGMKRLESIEPKFNRCVIFETNEISFHGHPMPLNTPPAVTRKSLATYYYRRPSRSDAIVEEHNTVYVNTEGFSGYWKRLRSGLRASAERISGRAKR